MIHLYNSLTRSVEPFVPNDPERVSMYVCGLTVYDKPHIGNARPAVVFDVLYRLLMLEYGAAKILFARNYTDIDDKIMERASELGEPIETVTSRNILEYDRVITALGNLQPVFRPSATAYIDQIKVMVAQLVAFRHAYVVEGHVFFDVLSWPSHGVLSGHKQENLEAGARDIKSVALKRSPGDFVLWKPSTPEQPGWDSIWGRGRPGWHIECSTMIDSLFDSQTIDIHGGGADLRFPHHEAEISQFEACNHQPLANYWIHNGMVTVGGKKMAKSEGNFISVEDALEGQPYGVLRLALLSSHYRQSLDWNDALLTNARQTLTGWYLALEGIKASPQHNDYAEPVLEALKTDLNTPLAIARLHAAVTRLPEADDAQSLAAGIRKAASALGINLSQASGEDFLRGGSDREEIEALIAARDEARKKHDFTTSDRLRNELMARGLVIEDQADTTRWRRA